MVKNNTYGSKTPEELQPNQVLTTSPASVGRDGNENLDLRLDTAFKHIFGQEVFMIDLLNSVLNRDDKITKLTYNPTESIPEYKDGKKVIFDLKCTTQSGEIFVVEMQYSYQLYFRDRALYYMARNLSSQLVNGDSRAEKPPYGLNPVYGIFLTCFKLDKEPRVMRDIVLCDRLNEYQQFSDRLRMIFLELPALKSPDECDTDMKKWIYVINNYRTMETMPFTDDKPIFKQLEEKAKLHALTPAEQELYEADFMNYWAYTGSMEYAEMKGRAEGRAEGEAKGIFSAALKLIKEKGWSIAEAASFFGIPESELVQY